MKCNVPYRASSLVCLLALALIAVGALPAVAAEQKLPAAASADLVPSALVAPPAGPGLATEREPVRFSWNLPADQPLVRTAPFVASSRAYWVRVSGAELAQGVNLPITGTGSLVRIQPAEAAATGLGTAAAAIDPQNLRVVAPGASEALTDGAALELVVDAERLAAADLPFAPGTSAFRFAAALGTGTFQVAAPSLAGSKGQYVVHVQEPNSPVALSLGADRTTYLHGDQLQARLDLSAAALDGAEVFVTSPSGRLFPASVTRSGDGLVAQLTLDAREPLVPGLWEVHAVARGQHQGQEILRHARTAFSAAVPTARLDGTVKVEQSLSRQGVPSVRATLGVETAASGRYEVRAVLWGTDASGVRQPLAAAAAAQWLEAGAGEVELRFERKVFRDTALGAPYEVRDLELRDQSRMALVETRSPGLVIAD